MTLDLIKEEVDRANTIVIVTHENPDGDAIGSSLATYISFKKLGKKVDIIIPEHSKIFNFLPCVDEIKTSSEVANYDLAISLDSSDMKRLSTSSVYFENAKRTIAIDHHGSNTMFADLNYVDPVSPACAQILVSLLKYWEMDISKEIGECLITGIITDTGGFKYSNVTAETFEFAADMLEKGINISKIYERVLQTITMARFKLRQIATDRLEFLEDGKIAFTYVNKEDEENVKAEIGDYEGIVEVGRGIEGVEVSVFMRETDKGYKISMRSTGSLNVADLCLIFGGGGHEKAAGCTLAYDFETAKKKILNEIKMLLK